MALILSRLGMGMAMAVAKPVILPTLLPIPATAVIQTGIHPAVSTARNINRYREQLDNLGFNYDWTRAVTTSDPKYYKWTQWIFLQLFDHYYDTESNRAEPISALKARFEKSGNAEVQAASSQEEIFTASAWANYSVKEQDDILMNYRLAYRKYSYVNWCKALGTIFRQ